jgi:hypothetical protein
MSDTRGTYSFLPWLRLGIANSISAADEDPAIALRAAIPVEIKLTGQKVDGSGELSQSISRDVDLYGPGDIIGIDKNAIIKTEPAHWITNFEPNYLAYIDFADPDFLWRYTPAAPDLARHRLRPWLTLLVVTDDEIEAGSSNQGALEVINLKVAFEQLLPPAEQLWAWAHVHVNEDLIQADGVTTSSDSATTRARVQALITQNSDLAYGRLLCPRKLEPNTGYHALLVPTFETGRLAGLGHDPAANPELFATRSAWSDYADRPTPSAFPVYHRWYFKTGTVGDFEYLVRLLKPRPADARLGRRDMDVQRPGSNLSGISEPALKGVLRLGGALKVPDEALSGEQEQEAAAYEAWDTPYPHTFQSELAEFINLSEDYVVKAPEDAHAQALHLAESIRLDPDPLITPPIYGRWHALTDRLLFGADGSEAPEPDNWVHELNLDPRWRVAAGFGTEVVQAKQEPLMDDAWGQVGEILEANARIRRAKLAMTTSANWHAGSLVPIGKALGAGRTLVMTAPVQRRIVREGMTVHHRVAKSTLPRAALSPTLRRVLRPRDHVAGKLGLARPGAAHALIERVNAGEVSAAPPRKASDTLPTVEAVSAELAPPAGLQTLLELARRHPWLLLLCLLILAFLFLLSPWAFAGALLAGSLVAALLMRARRKAKSAAALTPQGQSPAVIDALPAFPTFELATLGAGGDLTIGGADSPVATRFKLALKDSYKLVDLSADLGRPPLRQPLDLGALSAATLSALDPKQTVPTFTLAGINVPLRLLDQFAETFQEAMAYPEFDMPMYKPLLDLSHEHFLPNIDKIKPNTITLLETNQRFIEAYMVGLNHEFARELLWREYPTDQRGSYFRQFWDVSGVANREGLSPDALREKLKDIPPLDRWSKLSKLGDHDHREAPGDNEEELVLVIRGELLKKYPNAVIYAQRAKWHEKDGNIDPTRERMLDDGDPAEVIKTPLYEAKVHPDISFLGFDLTAKEAKGGSGRNNDSPPGWFFVIKERPGEPRFGLDIERSGPLNVWNDLAWPDVLPAGSRFLQIGQQNPPPLTEPLAGSENEEKIEQWNDDKGLSWSANMNAAELAYVLYQVPVLVAVHASEMLPR